MFLTGRAAGVVGTGTSLVTRDHTGLGFKLWFTCTCQCRETYSTTIWLYGTVVDHCHHRTTRPDRWDADRGIDDVFRQKQVEITGIFIKLLFNKGLTKKIH